MSIGTSRGLAADSGLDGVASLVLWMVEWRREDSSSDIMEDSGLCPGEDAMVEMVDGWRWSAS